MMPARSAPRAGLAYLSRTLALLGLLVSRGTAQTSGGTAIVQTLTYAGVSYPVPTDGQKVQLGAAHDFERLFTLQFTLNDNLKPRPVATPPAPTLIFLNAHSAPRALVVAGNGTIYGVVRGDGSTRNPGAIVDIASDLASSSWLATFDETGSVGTEPGDVLIDDGAGRLLGVTRRGGAHGKGAIFRFDPADHSLVNVFDFPADLPGVANGLVAGTDGTIYGISSVLAEAGRLEVASAFHGNPSNVASAFNDIGATLGTHGSIFRVGPGGEFAVLKSFDASEAAISSSLPPGRVVGQTATIPPSYLREVAPSAHVFSPCSLTRNGNSIHAWVSGGQYRIGIDGSNGGWWRATAQLEVTGFPVFSDSIIPGYEDPVFGRVEEITDSGSTLVFTDEAPNFGVQDGYEHTVRDGFETTDDYYPQATTRTRGTIAATKPNVSLQGRARRFAFGNDRLNTYRVDEYPAGGTGVLYSGARQRLLADFDRVFAIQPLPGTVPEDLLVVASPLPPGSSPGLYRIRTTDNVPPIAPDVDVRGALTTAFRPPVQDANYDPVTVIAVSPSSALWRSVIGSDNSLHFEPLYPIGGNLGPPVPPPALLPHETFTYTVRDSQGATATGTYLVGNSRPIAGRDHSELVSTEADGASVYRATLLANDTDTNNDPLAALLALPADDAVKIEKSGDGEAVIFRVPPGFTGRTLDYALTDGMAMRLGQVVVGNRAPVALVTNLQVASGGTVSVPLGNFASDADGDTLTFNVTGAASHGNARIESGKVFYTSTAGYLGSDDFVVNVQDAFGGSLAQTVLVQVLGRPPIGIAVDLQLNASGIASISATSVFTAVGGGPLMFRIVTPPAQGVAAIVDGTITYTAQARQIGDDAFEVEADDGHGGVTRQTVHVKVPFARVRGAVIGWVSDNDSRLVLRMQVNAAGRATMVLQLDAGRAQARMDLTKPGPHTATTTGPHGEVIVIELPEHGTTGRVTVDGRVFYADFQPAIVPAPGLTGQFNVVLERDSSEAMHYGFAMLQVDRSGSARITGRTPDNAAWTAGARLMEGNMLLFLTHPGSPRRVLSAGWYLSSLTRPPSLDGDAVWKRPAGDEMLLSGGTKYRPPAAGLNVFGKTVSTVEAVISVPGQRARSTSLTLDRTNTTSPLSAGPVAARVVFNPATGFFTGAAMLNGRPVVLPFAGVLRDVAGFGPLVSPAGAGSIVLLPRALPAGGSGNFGSLTLQWQGSTVAGGFEETAIIGGVTFTSTPPPPPPPPLP